MCYSPWYLIDPHLTEEFAYGSHACIDSDTVKNSGKVRRVDSKC